jgi:hypothetical protein
MRHGPRPDTISSTPCVSSTDFGGFTQPDHRARSQWLLPIAVTTVSAVSVAEVLMVELRRQGIAAPGVTVINRLVATAMLGAERKVAEQLTRGLSESQCGALDALLDIHAQTAISTLARARQPPRAPSFRALARLIEQLDHLHQIEPDPGVRAAIHSDRGKQLAQEGNRTEPLLLRCGLQSSRPNCARACQCIPDRVRTALPRMPRPRSS